MIEKEMGQGLCNEPGERKKCKLIWKGEDRNRLFYFIF